MKQAWEILMGLSLVEDPTIDPHTIMLVGRLTDEEKRLPPDEQLKIRAKRSAVLINVGSPESRP